MGSLWAALAPFIIASALMPVELVITLALLGTPGRVRTAGAAGMPKSTNAVTYLVFVVLGVSSHLAIIAAAAFFPNRSRAFLDRSLLWLQDHNRIIMVGLGLVFGGWFLIKGLHGFGIS